MRRWLRADWAPLLLALGWMAATAWVRPLALPDEGRYVGVAWGMITSGDWLVPQLNGLPYFHKPPLFYWITAGSLSLFGTHEWAARLAPLLGAALGATALFLFARRWFGDREARLALLALATQPLFYLGGQYANLDMLVAGCIAVTIAAFAHALLLQAQGERARGALAAGYLFAALGLLAKGLIGVVLPGLVLVAWVLVQRRPLALLRLVWLPGLALFLAVAAPWFIAMQERFPEFFHYFFVVQHFSRFASSGFNNPQPAWFYPAVLLLAALPWSVWALVGLKRADATPDPLRRNLRQLLWIWLVAMVAFFSLPQSKLVGYILPATMPLALLAAEAFDRRAGSLRAQRLWRVSGALAVAGCVGGLALGAVYQHGTSSQRFAQALLQGVQAGDRVVFVNGYYFDLPVYARLRAPVVVVDDWDQPKVAGGRDDWRKEMADAARFAPEQGVKLLLTPRQLPTTYCDSVATWVIGSASLPSRFPLLEGAVLMAANRGNAMWRLEPVPPGVSRPGCPGMPSASSGDKS